MLKYSPSSLPCPAVSNQLSSSPLVLPALAPAPILASTTPHPAPPGTLPEQPLIRVRRRYLLLRGDGWI